MHQFWLQQAHPMKHSLSAQQTLLDLADYRNKSKLIRGFKPRNIKNISEHELAPIKTHILQYIQTVAAATSDFLK